MADHPRAVNTEADWILRATWHDYRLAPEAPVYCLVSSHPEPTPLRIDLHEAIEVGIMLRGRQERHYPGWMVELTAGDAWLQPMWEPHACRTTAPDTENVVVIFLPEFLGDERIGDISWLSLFAAPRHLRPWVRDDGLRAKVLEIGRELAEEIRARPRGWTGVVRLGLLRLLFLLERHWARPAAAADMSDAKPSNLSRVMPAIALIQRRPPGATRIEDAAAACGLSRSRFGTLFRQTMGTSFGQFALRARLAYASYRLLTTDMTVEAIAQRAGFVDASHLHRTFVKHYGVTPHQYRAASAHGTSPEPGARARGTARRPGRRLG